MIGEEKKWNSKTKKIAPTDIVVHSSPPHWQEQGSDDGILTREHHHAWCLQLLRTTKTTKTTKALKNTLPTPLATADSDTKRSFWIGCACDHMGICSFNCLMSCVHSYGRWWIWAGRKLIQYQSIRSIIWYYNSANFAASRRDVQLPSDKVMHK